jgi:acyl-coenzyme A synthetase/AMP-(fatty) acid ligase
LGEVEASLRACPDVLDAAVVLHSPPGHHPSLLAHVVATAPAAGAPGRTLDADDSEHSRRVVRAIRRNLAAVLPHYMIPQHIRLVATLPQTESGKTDRGALVPSSSPPDQ